MNYSSSQRSVSALLQGMSCPLISSNPVTVGKGGGMKVIASSKKKKKPTKIATPKGKHNHSIFIVMIRKTVDFYKIIDYMCQRETLCFTLEYSRCSQLVEEKKKSRSTSWPRPQDKNTLKKFAKSWRDKRSTRYTCTNNWYPRYLRPSPASRWPPQGRDLMTGR